MTRPSGQHQHVIGGVYASDPKHPAPPPEGAVAAAIVDTAGTVIGWYWVVAGLGAAAERDAWVFFDRHGDVTPAASSYPRPHLMAEDEGAAPPPQPAVRSGSAPLPRSAARGS